MKNLESLVSSVLCCEGLDEASVVKSVEKMLFTQDSVNQI